MSPYYCRTVGHWTHNILTSVSWVLGLQECTTYIPQRCLIFPLILIPMLFFVLSLAVQTMADYKCFFPTSNNRREALIHPWNYDADIINRDRTARNVGRSFRRSLPALYSYKTRKKWLLELMRGKGRSNLVLNLYLLCRPCIRCINNKA